MKESRAPLVIAVVLLLLPVLYVGSYCVALRSSSQMVGLNALLPKGASPDYYRFGGVWSKRVYWPLEWVDRRLRPKAWAQIDPPMVQWRMPTLLNLETGEPESFSPDPTE
ncbi:hypothetical protein [Anatilimnocola floriformis]|uniref:hypothetical protein n=1 Tax=Anatilimnocola floriformis TaxID=2948575 RepID=UPI0020C3DAFC|nr:hypothetical protein [Anatilimnocola floriformis]